MSTRYPRRPERPRTDLNTPEWRERLNSIESWINQLLHNNEPRLEVGAIWGPRGSGKTSLLQTLARELQQKKPEGLVLPTSDSQPREARDTDPRDQHDPLFAPDLIDDTNGDHLFSHLLTFLGSSYDGLRGTTRLQNSLAILTQHRHFDDLKSFEADTATSTKSLHDSLTKRLSDRAVFSAKLRRALSGSVPRDARYLLLVDDIDLVPHRGPELITLLHLYLRDLPFIVLLAADREQLVKHTAVYLKSRHGHTDRSLAIQTLAKQIPYEWHVPRPTSAACREDFFDRGKGGPAIPDRLGPIILKSFEDASSPLRNGWSRHLQRMKAARREEQMRVLGTEREDSDTHLESPPSWVSQAEELLDEFIARNWRTINISYNRLATLVETLKNDEQRTSELIESLGISRDLLIPFLTVFTALDAQLPELALQDALERDPVGLHGNLPRSDADQLGAKANEVDPDRRPAPLDRLGPPWLTGRMVDYARDRLTKLATVWDVMRAYEKVDETTVYGISLGERAYADIHALGEALAHSGLNFGEPILIAQQEKSTLRPGAGAIGEVLKDTDFLDTLAKIVPNAALYPRAPLSLVAWLGWHLRQRVGQPTVLGLFDGSITPYRARTSEIRRDTREPLLLQTPIAISLASEHSTTPDAIEERPGEALILLDVRRNPDLSSRALPLWSLKNKRIHPEHLYKLASHPGFAITPDNFLDVLTDVLWLFRSLKDDRGITRFHLALATSVPLAFFVGREIHAFIPIDLYEHDPDTSSYRYVTTLK